MFLLEKISFISYKLIFLIFLLLWYTPFANADSMDGLFDEGIEYELIQPFVKTSTPSKVVVTEIFWYGCPYCYKFEPFITEWEKTKPKGVVFERVPSVMALNWLEYARAFYTLEKLGKLEKVHSKIFEAIHRKKMYLDDVDSFSTLISSLGLDEKAFQKIYQSKEIDSMVRKARNKERLYGSHSVPTIIINGKYRTDSSLAGSNAEVIRVINFLIKKEM